jgi:hypothetical protein
MKYIYLSGPISGRSREEYAAHFTKVGWEIESRALDEDLGVRAFNPVSYCDIKVEDGSPWHIYMRTCIGKLVECDGIGLLQGWEKSRGAITELNLAIDLHIPIVYIEPPLTALGLYMFFGHEPGHEIYDYYLRRLYDLETINPDTAEDRALVETANRYLDPHGFEYIEKPF